MKGLNISEVWEEDVTSLKIETILTAYQKMGENAPINGGGTPLFSTGGAPKQACWVGGSVIAPGDEIKPPVHP